MEIVAVIMAGGAGTRLWPLSREEKPKQFHDLTGEGTLMQLTMQRLKGINPSDFVIVTGKKYEALSLSELENCALDGAVLSEPCPRNTAAAVLYAALYCQKRFENAVMVVLPADHYIRDRDAFIDTLSLAIKEAETGSLVTIGVNPGYPETGYGYIKSGQMRSESVYEVERFVEKPDIETARHYVASGQYHWNSGIFVWQSSSILEAFKKNMADLFSAFTPFAGMHFNDIAANHGPAWETKKAVYEKISSVSIDHGILEKAGKRSVVTSSFGWADLGSWKSIDSILANDSENNRSSKKEKALFVDTEGSSVFPDKSRITLVGVSNLVVVESGDEILVMDKDSAQDVRKVVEIINADL